MGSLSVGWEVVRGDGQGGARFSGRSRECFDFISRRFASTLVSSVSTHQDGRRRPRDETKTRRVRNNGFLPGVGVFFFFFFSCRSGVVVLTTLLKGP